MKKQYLISLLGITALTIPLGNSFLNTSSSSFVAPIEEESLNTGITINEEQSKVSVEDFNDSSKIDDGEKISAVDLTIDYNPENVTSNLKLASGGGFNIYYAAEVGEGPFKVSYSAFSDLEFSEIIINDEVVEGNINFNPEKDKATLTLSKTAPDNINGEDWWNKIWNYSPQDDGDFVVTIDTSLGLRSKYREVEIGKVPLVLSSDSITSVQTPKAATTNSDGKSATIDYIVTPGWIDPYDHSKGNYEIEKIEWFDGVGGALLASQTENFNEIENGVIEGSITTNKIKSDTSYNDAELKVTMSNDHVITSPANFITFNEEFPGVSEINTDENNGILQAKGETDNNFNNELIVVNSVSILDKEDKVVGTSNITQNELPDPSKTEFAVYTENYFVDPELELDSYQNYTLQFEGVVQQKSGDDIDHFDFVYQQSLKEAENIHSGGAKVENGLDLTGLLPTTKFPIWAIILIIIAGIVVIGAIGYFGYTLYEKNKAKQA